MSSTTYATREQVAAASDVKMSAYMNTRIDRLLNTAARNVERMLHRKFYPTTASVTFEWPPRGTVFLPDDLQSVTTLTIDGTTVTGFELNPEQSGPPYVWIDFDNATSSGGDEVTITGVWGFSNDTESAGALDAAISTTSETTITITDASLIGVGDQILIDDERMVVTGKASSDTGTTLNSNIDASNATTTVPVADGTAINIGEIITIDSERMEVYDITSNNLLVKRAVDGTTIASHTSSATVYALRSLTVTRGDAGTTAATHTDTTSISKNVPPPMIVELVMAEAQYLLGQEKAEWNMTIGTGENLKESSGKGIRDIRIMAQKLYGRGRWQRHA